MEQTSGCESFSETKRFCVYIYMYISLIWNILFLHTGLLKLLLVCIMLFILLWLYSNNFVCVFLASLCSFFAVRRHFFCLLLIICRDCLTSVWWHFKKEKKDIFLDYIIINSSSAAAAAFAFYSSRLIIIFQSGVLRRFHIIQHVILQNVYIFRRSPLILFRITFLYISIIICRNKKPKTKSPIFLRNNNKIRGYLLYMYILVYN